MHGINPMDKGRRIDWGKISGDDAVCRRRERDVR